MDQITSRDGTTIAFWRSGDGSPLLLIHGAVADHTRWAPVLSALEARHTVYAVDRRGRGGSGDSLPYAVEREFEDIAAVIDAIDSPVHVLGHSFGALCALAVPRYTANIRSLVVYEPPPLGGPELMPLPLAGQLQDLIDRDERDAAIAIFLREVAKVPESDIAMLRTLPSWQGRVDAAHTIIREVVDLPRVPPYAAADMATITVPVLMLLGGASVPPYPETTRMLHAMLPTSRIAELPGQGHIAMSTAPDLFLREVLGFLDGIAG